MIIKNKQKAPYINRVNDIGEKAQQMQPTDKFLSLPDFCTNVLLRIFQ